MQVIRRLRERGEPIRLFGESDYDAFQRLRKIEIQAPEVNKVRATSPLAIFTLMSYSVCLFTGKTNWMQSSVMMDSCWIWHNF